MHTRSGILAVTELILGAVYSDAPMTEEEERAARDVLGSLLECPPDVLPPEVDERFYEFSPVTFDLAGAADEFLRTQPIAARRLLEVLAELTDRDGTDLAEDDYLRGLADHFALPAEQYSDLVLDYEVALLPSAGSATPPPLPEAARKPV